MNDVDRRPRVGLATHGLWRLREDVAVLLEAAPVRVFRVAPPEVDLMAGWGYKARTAFARRLAARRGVPYVALEDGFLRSVRPGRSPSLSYVVDEAGIYYDARQASRLENLLQDPGWLEPGEEERGLAAAALLRTLKLSKYNTASDVAPHPPIGILVIDQTAGDASITGSLAAASSFGTMLDAAIERVGREAVYVKLHPETIEGRKKGNLVELAAERGVRIVEKHRTVWSVLDAAREVYTVSSQLGFEALLVGLPVTCFGMPFYAGWGLTSDRVACPRRTGRPSLGALAAATFFRYTRYLDPWRRHPIGFEEAVDALGFLRDRYHENRRRSVLVGMSWAERAALHPFLTGPAGAPRSAREPAVALAEAKVKGDRIVVLDRRLPGIADRASSSGVPLLRAEEGPIRAADFGARAAQPLSFAFDAVGAGDDAAGIGRFEALAREAELGPALIARAAALRAALVGLRAGGAGAAGRSVPLPDDGRRKVLVIGVRDEDASVARGTSDGGDRGFLGHVRSRRPDALIVCRPDADAPHGARSDRPGDEAAPTHGHAIRTDAPIAELLDWCDALETTESRAGFHALLAGKPVTLHGRPFYGGWGLTEDLLPFPGRSRRLSLDELVALALILHPRYVDPVSGQPCEPETIVERIATGRLRPEGRWSRLAEIGRYASALF